MDHRVTSTTSITSPARPSALARPTAAPRRSDSSQAFRAVTAELAAGRAEAVAAPPLSPAQAAATIARLESELCEARAEARKLAGELRRLEIRLRSAERGL